jgi:hypothetical protein
MEAPMSKSGIGVDSKSHQKSLTMGELMPDENVTHWAKQALHHCLMLRSIGKQKYLSKCKEEADNKTILHLLSSHTTQLIN